MNAILNECQSWIDQRYVASFPSESDLHRWHLVGADFHTIVGGKVKAAILEDIELGLLLVFIPLETEEAVRTQVDQDLHQALSLRSRLLPAERQGDIQSRDQAALGTWRVALHWLMPKAYRDTWEASLRLVRAQSSAFDDVSVDGIFLGNSTAQALEEHGLPRLLFDVRQVFRKSAAEVGRWSSADDRVGEALRGFAGHFSNPLEVEIARNLEQIAKTFAGSTHEPLPESLERFQSVHIRNVRAVRNLRVESLDAPTRKARVCIIHGPNGTGKSTLAEALSMKYFGTSKRHAKFLTDPDVASGKTSEGYVTKYLRDMRLTEEKNENPSPPSIGIDEGELTPLSSGLVSAAEKAKEKMAKAEGTLASQEDSISFLGLTGPELATQLSRHLSKLAEKVVDLVETGFSEAQKRRSDFTRQFGMTANTKLEETIRRKIVERTLSEALPRPDARTLDFLKMRTLFQDSVGIQAAGLLARMDNTQAIEGTMKRILKLNVGSISGMSNPIAALIEERATAIMEINGLVAAFLEHTRIPEEERKELRQYAEQWSMWLNKPPLTTAQGPPDSKHEEEEHRLGSLIKTREEIRQLGSSMSPHHEHLLKARTFIDSHWKAEHADLCPTCKSHIPGGIEAIVTHWFAEVDQKINEYRNRYKALSDEIRNMETTLQVTNQAQCPVPELGRHRIEHWLTSVLETSAKAEFLLASTDTKEPTLRLFRFLEAPPGVTEIPRGIPEEAQRLADVIGAKWAEAQVVSEEPDAWENVQKHLQQTLKEVVESHLPRTFQAVWREIMSNLRSGPWVIPGDPSLQADLRRGKQRMDVMVGKGDHLARYMLNGAEMHTLGLAWFFTRHVVESRFRHGWMLLDDPAQEMDQPTFRELCRFLATLRRIYEFHGQKQEVENKNVCKRSAPSDIIR